MGGATGPELLRAERLSKTYVLGRDDGKDITVHALRDVSLSVYEGEFIAVVGRNGSGKTTLVNCLGALDRPDLVNEQQRRFCLQFFAKGGAFEVWGYPSWYRQNFVGVVFQSFHLLSNMNVEQNVELPLRLHDCERYEPSSKERRKRVHEVLERLGIAEHQRKRVSQLSGGERQRVAIARALVKGPALLLADEPTGNLDDHNKEQLVEQLHALTQDGVTVIMVTHDLEYARRFASRIIVLKDGAIEEDRPNRATYVPDALPVSNAGGGSRTPVEREPDEAEQADVTCEEPVPDEASVEQELETGEGAPHSDPEAEALGTLPSGPQEGMEGGASGEAGASSPPDPSGDGDGPHAAAGKRSGDETPVESAVREVEPTDRPATAEPRRSGMPDRGRKPR